MRTHQADLCSPGGLASPWMHYTLLEVCMLQEAYESYKVKAKTSICQHLGLIQRKPTSCPRAEWAPSTHSATYRWARSSSGAGRTLEEEENSEALVRGLHPPHPRPPGGDEDVGTMVTMA